jgi:hypothetical protein
MGPGPKTPRTGKTVAENLRNAKYAGRRARKNRELERHNKQARVPTSSAAFYGMDYDKGSPVGTRGLNASLESQIRAKRATQKPKVAVSLAHPQRPKTGGDQRVGSGSQTGTQPIVAKSLEHPHRNIPSDNRLGYNPGSPTFNGATIKTQAPPLPRSKAGYKPKQPGIATTPTPTLTISAKTAPTTSSKEGFGSRFRKALKFSAQTQNIKALQRQHKAARSG